VAAGWNVMGRQLVVMSMPSFSPKSVLDLARVIKKQLLTYPILAILIDIVSKLI